MSIVFIFGNSHCHGDEVATSVAERLEYRRVDDRLVPHAVERFGVAREKLERAIRGSPPFFNRLTHEHERNLAVLRLALAEIVQADDLVFHGVAGFLLPRAMSHVLRVYLTASQQYRVDNAVRETGASPKEALKSISRDDAESIRWTHQTDGQDPRSEGYYDIVLPMHDVSVAEAVATICEHAVREVVRATPLARRAAADFLLASRVNLALASKGHTVEVSALDGRVSVGINKYVVNLDRQAAKLAELAREVEGVRDVEVGPGSQYVPPSLVGLQDLEVPTKVLLVDDEREFVHTLSDRLRTRRMASEVVYDGEQALAVIESEPPEVMVLDLKMPGIDGMEVLRRVKESHPQVEVIILTGHGSEREEKRAHELGAFAYLKKPVDIDVLAQTMRAAYRKLGKDPGKET